MRTLWVVTGIAIGLLVAFGINVVWKATNPPSLGDWSSFAQAIAATLAFIWLVYGQYENQKSAVEAKKELADQLEITREVVGALTRLASGTQVQAAETLKSAEPVFRHLENSEPHKASGIASARPTRGSLAFRNEGGPAKLLSMESRCAGMTAKLESPGWCRANEVFHVFVEATGPLKAAGSIDVTVAFEDKFHRRGTAHITAPGFGEWATIEIQIGDQAVAT